MKNAVIALLIGLLFGQLCNAQPAPNLVSRRDLFEAAALIGVLANPAHDPFGSFSFTWFRQPSDFTRVSQAYADAALKESHGRKGNQ